MSYLTSIMQSETAVRQLPNTFVLNMALLFCCCLWAVTPLAQASSNLSQWQTQVPSSLAALKQPADKAITDLSLLAGDGVFFFPHRPKPIKIHITDGNSKVTKESLRKSAIFSTGSVVLNAPVSQVKHTLSQYRLYPKIFPKLVSAKVLQQQDNLARVKYHVLIDIPVPILKFDEKFVLRHQMRGNRLSTWIEDAPIKYGMGEFEWFDLGNDKTLLTLTQWGDLDSPKGLVLPLVLKSLPEIKQAVPHSMTGYTLEALRLYFNGQDRLIPYQGIPTWRVNAKAQDSFNQLLSQTQDLPLMYSHPPVITRDARKNNRAVPLRFVSSLQQLSVPQSNLNQWLLNPNRYPDLISQIRSVSMQPYRKGKRVTTDIRVGLGVLSIPFQTKIYYRQPNSNTARFSQLGGDIRWIEGMLSTKAVNSQSSLMQMTFANKTDEDAPFLLRIGHALPYNDYLSSMGVAPVFGSKIKNKVAKD